MIDRIWNPLSALLDSQITLMVGTMVFLVLNVLDGHSTWLVIRPCHYHRERNPVARWAFRKLGLPHGIAIFKALVFLVLIPAGAWYAAHDARTLNIVLVVANLLFCYVVWHNYRTYLRIAAYRKN